VPISIEEARAVAVEIERFGDERLVQFCEVDGRPAGIVVAFPDWNQALRGARGRLLPLGWWRIPRARRRINRVRIWLLSIAPEWQGTGLAGAFLALVDQPGTEQYTELEASWIVESHQIMVRALNLIGARVSKRYRVYDAALD
jgi:GNAT superfamily N-acetyltransferase